MNILPGDIFEHKRTGAQWVCTKIARLEGPTPSEQWELTARPFSPGSPKTLSDFVRVVAYPGSPENELTLVCGGKVLGRIVDIGEG